MSDFPPDIAGHDDFYGTKPKPTAEPTVFDRTGFGSVKFKTGTANVNPDARKRQRDRFAEIERQFLASGRTITQCPPGKPPKFRFGRFITRAVERNPRVGLTQPISTAPILTEAEERDFLRQAKSGDERAKRKLFERFHRLILKVTGGYWGPAKDDLVAAGSLGFFEAVKRFDLKRNTGRLSTYAEFWIRKYLGEEIRKWDGLGGESRAYRYLVSHPNASVENIVKAVGCKPKSAEQAVERAGGEVVPHDDLSDRYVTPRWEVRRLYDAHGQNQQAGHLRHWKRASNLVDLCADETDKWAARRLKEIGRRAYALELVEKQIRQLAAAEERDRAEWAVACASRGLLAQNPRTTAAVIQVINRQRKPSIRVWRAAA